MISTFLYSFFEFLLSRAVCEDSTAFSYCQRDQVTIDFSKIDEGMFGEIK